MTGQQRTTAELRAMAEEALRLAEKATEGPWGFSGLPYNEIDDPIIYSETAKYADGDIGVYVAQTVYDMQSPTQKHNIEVDTRFIAGSRQLVPNLATALLAALDRVDELEKVEKAARAFVTANKAQHENGAWVIGEKSRLNNELYHAGVDALEIYWRVDRVSLDDKLIEAAKTTLEDLEREVGS